MQSTNLSELPERIDHVSRMTEDEVESLDRYSYTQVSEIMMTTCVGIVAALLAGSAYVVKPDEPQHLSAEQMQAFTYGIIGIGITGCTASVISAVHQALQKGPRALVRQIQELQEELDAEIEKNSTVHSGFAESWQWFRKTSTKLFQARIKLQSMAKGSAQSNYKSLRHQTLDDIGKEENFAAMSTTELVEYNRKHREVAANSEEIILSQDASLMLDPKENVIFNTNFCNATDRADAAVAHAKKTVRQLQKAS